MVEHSAFSTQLCTEAWREHLPVGQKAAQGQDFRACREAQEPQHAEELPQSGEMGAQLLAGGGQEHLALYDSKSWDVLTT